MQTLSPISRSTREISDARRYDKATLTAAIDSYAMSLNGDRKAISREIYQTLITTGGYGPMAPWLRKAVDAVKLAA